MSSGRVLGFHGGQPGAGKTFLSQNLSSVFSRRGRKVLLLDFDPNILGLYQVHWDLAPGPSLAESLRVLSRFDENTIHGYFPRSRCGVSVAALAGDEAGALSVTEAQVLRGLALFRSAFDYVILDGLEGWDAMVLATLDACDLVFMVCGPDLAGLRYAARDLEQSRRHKFPAAKISLILNRSGKGALAPADLEQAFPGHRCLAALPYDPRAPEAVSRHLALASLYPLSDFSRRMTNLAETVDAMAAPSAQRSEPAPPAEVRELAPGTPGLSRTQVKEKIHGLLLDHPELRELSGEPTASEQARALMREKVMAVAAGLMALEAPEIAQRSAREQLVREVVDEALGLGPLEDFIRDAEITEIMVNRRDQIYIERAGKLELTDKHFLSDKQLRTVIERIVAPLGRRVDESQPYVDARLADGSRVNAILPPLALKGPALTIRKFARQRFTMEELVRGRSLTPELAEFLRLCVQGRRNILIAGGTGSGKTTLLNILAGCIEAGERIITVEDAAELNLPQPHVLTLETRPPNIEGRGAVTIRDLVKNCLRMRPDRIVVGECRSGEALDMLQAMNTGHDGSLTTIHANAPKDSLSRLETLVLMAGMELPARAIREQIAAAIHLVVQVARVPDGSRKITQVADVAGIEDGVIQLRDLFILKTGGESIRATGQMPGFAAELSRRGLNLPSKWFKP